MNHITLLQLFLFFLGLFTGLYSAVVGGGALVLVPVFTLLGLPLPAAIATMRFSAVFVQLVAVFAFIKAKAVEWNSSLWIGLCCLPGGYLGALVVVEINQRLLGQIVAAILAVLLVAILLFDRRKLKRKRKNILAKSTVLSLVALGLGFYGGFYGAGFSTLLMLAYFFVGGSTLLTSSANASVAAFAVSLPASYIFFQSHLVHLDIFFPVTLGGMIGSWLGVESAAKWGVLWIRKLLIVVVTASILKLLLFPA